MDGVDAEVMVEVPVGAEQVHGLQLVVLDIVDNGVALLVVVGTTIDDDTLFGLIAHHVGVLLQEIEHERLYSH